MKVLCGCFGPSAQCGLAPAGHGVDRPISTLPLDPRARLTHGARSAQIRALLREARAHTRRTLTLLALASGGSAGHRVLRSNSSAVRSTPMAKVNRRDAETPRYRTGGTGWARATGSGLLDGVARSTVSDLSSPRLCVSAVKRSSPAGHRLHRSFSKLCLSAGLRAHLRSSAASTPFTAGHEVDRSILESPPAETP